MTKTAIRWRALLRGPGYAVLLTLLVACAPFRGAPPGRPASAASAANAPAPNAPASNAPAANAPAPNAPAGNAPADAAPAPPRVVAGSVAEREFLGAAAPADIDRAERRFYVYGNALPAQYPVDWFQIRFMTADGQGNLFPVTAQLLVPRTPEAAQLPLYVFAPGTTGLGAACAPSTEQPLERDWGDFEAHLLSYASRGYIAVMPDYAGFDDPVRHQYYYVAEMHAHVLLDAARAAYRFFDGGGGSAPAGARPANAVFFAGYSQGGHAAFVARDYAPRYAPELSVRGAIAYGGRGDVSTLFTEFPALGPYLLYAYSAYYGADKVDPAQYLLPRWLPTLAEDVTTLCIDEVPGYYGDDPRRIYRPEFLNALQNGRLGQEYPTLKALLDQNSAGVGGKDTPVLFLQGLADTIVTPHTSRAYLRRICDAGGQATYLTYEDIPHVLTRQVSYRDTLEWMETVLKGDKIPSDC
jgi:Secretory lipase